MSVVTSGPKSFTCRTNSEYLGAWGVRCGSVERKPPILVASGSSEDWSPIGLLVGAVETSVILTLQRLLESRGVPIEACTSEAEALVELDEGSYRIERVLVKPSVVVVDAATKATVLKLMEIAEHEAMVANALAAPVVVQASVTLRERGGTDL